MSPPSTGPAGTPPVSALHAAAFPSPEATGADRLASRRKRRRRFQLAILAVIGLCIAGAAVPVVRGVQNGIAERQIPEVTTSGYRSTMFTETIVAPVSEGGVRTEIVANADSVDQQVQIEVLAGDGISWRGDENEWFQQDESGVWTRYPNTADDDAIFSNVMTLADGLTVDEVLPRSAHRFTDITSVERTEMLGEDVRHFTVLVDINAMDAQSSNALTQLQQFWAVLDLNEFDASTGLAIEFWTTDEGMVHKVRSQGTPGLGSYILTFDSGSADPFDAAFPIEFIDG